MGRYNDSELPDYIMVTVVARRGDKRVVKDMTYGEAKELPFRMINGKKTTWKYTFYEQGFTDLKSN